MLDKETQTELNEDITETEDEVTKDEVNEDEYNEIWDKDVSFDDLKEFKINDEPRQEKTIDDIINEEKQDDNSNQNFITLTRPLKYRGKEIYPQTEEELIELAQKGLDYSFKMNKIKPYRDLITYLEDNNIQPNDVISKLKNNNDFVQTEQNTFGSDAQTELDYSGHFLSKQLDYYSKVDKNIAIKIAKTFDSLPNEFKVEIANGNLGDAFATSIASGEFDRVYGEAKKVKEQNPYMSWIEAYKLAGQNIVNPKITKDSTEPDVKDKKVKTRNRKKTIEEQYNEIWENNEISSLEDLEKILIQGV